MKTARALAAHAAATHKHVPKKCIRGVGSPIASPFNARGVVADPSFGLSRPTAKGEIEFDIQAHEVAPRQWIAQSSWIWREGSMPMDAAPSDKTLPRFESRSEAVYDAISRAMREISEQRVRLVERAPWALKSEGLRAWTIDAIFQTREEDDGLALHKRTIIDVFAGAGGEPPPQLEERDGAGWECRRSQRRSRDRAADRSGHPGVVGAAFELNDKGAAQTSL